MMLIKCCHGPRRTVADSPRIIPIIPARGAMTALALDHGQSPPGLRGFAQPAALTLMQIKE